MFKVKEFRNISEQIQKRITQFLETVDGTESVLDKIILDMKKRLGEAKELVAVAMAEEQRLKHAYQEAVATAEMWRKREDKALVEGDADRARDARQRKQQQLDRAAEYKRQIEAQAAVVNRLKTALHEFYQQFQVSVQRAETLCERRKRAETRADLYKLMFDDIGDSVAKAFEEAARALKALELEAEVWESTTPEPTPEAKATRKSANVDKALAALKKDVLGRK